jgi:putative transposase
MSSRRRIIDDKLYAHFITFSVTRRRRLLDHEHPKRIVMGVLNYVLDKHAARCRGFVIMPDHVHALVWFPEPGQLSAFMHEWKRQSSLRIHTWYREEAPHYAEQFSEGGGCGNQSTTPLKSTSGGSSKRSFPICT